MRSMKQRWANSLRLKTRWCCSPDSLDQLKDIAGLLSGLLAEIAVRLPAINTESATYLPPAMLVPQGAQGDNAALIAELQALRKEVAELRAENRTGRADGGGGNRGLCIRQRIANCRRHRQGGLYYHCQTGSRTYMTDADFQNWLKRGGRFVALVEVQTSPVRYLSTVAYTTLPTDTPANRVYSPVVAGGVALSDLRRWPARQP